MKSTKIYILAVLVTLFPFGFAHAIVDSYIKYGGVEGEVKAEESGTLGLEREAPETRAVPTSESSVDDGGKERAGPALLEIDTVRGESPEKEKSTSQYNESDIDFLQKNPITVEARDIRGWEEGGKEAFLETVKEHAQVNSGQELENFAKGVLLKDENIKSIEASENKVVVAYEMPARFLGIFSASLRARAEVARDGEARVTFPWYSFLFKKLVLASDIESETEANLPEVGDEVLVSFQARARAITTLSNVMKTRHDTAKNSINNIR